MKSESDNMPSNTLLKIYTHLLKSYGPQGWWPIDGIYHKGNYEIPKTNSQRFEICIGAILTQNTSWLHVEKALTNLKNLNALNPNSLKDFPLSELKSAIKPAGYFNQKAKKLREFTSFYTTLKGRTPTREELLNLWGIGPETADSML